MVIAHDTDVAASAGAAMTHAEHEASAVDVASATARASLGECSRMRNPPSSGPRGREVAQPTLRPPDGNHQR